MAGVRMLHSLMRGLYLIDERAFNTYGPRVMNLLRDGASAGLFSDDKPKMPSVEYIKVENGRIVKTKEASTSGLTAVIPVHGALMKANDEECGILGMSGMRQMVLDAQANPNVDSIIIDIDSPGGSVDGTFELADAIYESTKPVYAYVNGLAASAGYAIASAAQGGIYASHATAEIGSIGTAISFWDFTKYYEERGMKQHYINADGSPDKNMDYFKALAGDYQPIIKGLLNPTNEIFHRTVQRNREGKLNMEGKEPLTGKVYVAERAMEMGLIDGIMTMEQLVGSKNSGRAAATHEEGTTNNSETHMKIKLMGAWTALITFFGLNAPAADQSIEHDVTNANWGELNNQLAERNQLSEELATANERITSLEAELSQAQTALANEQDAHAATRANNPAAAAEKPEATADDFGTTEAEAFNDLEKEAIAMRKAAGLV